MSYVRAVNPSDLSETLLADRWIESQPQLADPLSELGCERPAGIRPRSRPCHFADWNRIALKSSTDNFQDF